MKRLASDVLIVIGLRERPVKNRAHAVNAAQPTAEVTVEAAKALRYYRHMLKTARDYQRIYYAKNRDRILRQRKERAEKLMKPERAVDTAGKLRESQVK